MPACLPLHCERKSVGLAGGLSGRLQGVWDGGALYHSLGAWPMRVHRAGSREAFPGRCHPSRVRALGLCHRYLLPRRSCSGPSQESFLGRGYCQPAEWRKEHQSAFVPKFRDTYHRRDEMLVCKFRITAAMSYMQIFSQCLAKRQDLLQN